MLVNESRSEGRRNNSMCLDVSYRKDSNDATRDATPQTITVALVRFEPVPLPEAPPGIFEKLRPGRGLTDSTKQ